MRRPRAVFARCRGTFREAPGGRGRGRAAAAGGRADPPGRTAMARRPWPRLPQHAPKPARSRRFCARLPQAYAVPAAAVRGGGTGWRFPTPHPMAVRSHRSCARPPRACAAEGRAGASPPHIPWPRVRIVPVHGRRGRARRRDGPALLHPTSHGRAFAALKFIPCAGRICAYSRCAAAASASAQSVRSQGRSRSARPKWP